MALLLETPTGDHDWNDSLAAGLEQARNEFGVRTSVVVAPAGHDDNALQEMFRTAAQNNDLVLVASDGLHEVLRNNAANFRRTMFGCIDAGVRAPNIMSVTFADEQAAYLAGAAAAMTAQQTSLPGIGGKKIIGWISGQDSPAMPKMPAAIGADDFNPMPIGIGHTAHRTGDFLVETGPAAAGFKFVVRPVERHAALPANVGSRRMVAHIFPAIGGFRGFAQQHIRFHSRKRRHGVLSWISPAPSQRRAVRHHLPA